jgi:nucleotide-binding universal stress UspA family protein
MEAQTFQKILVPIDDSDHARNAFRYVLGLVDLRPAHVALLHCYGRIPMLIGGEARKELQREYLQQTEKLLAPYAKKLRASGCEPALIIKEGKPGEVIANESAAGGYDLIVMGFRGESELEGLIMGSTAHSVLAAASCPVLLVR